MYTLTVRAGSIWNLSLIGSRSIWFRGLIFSILKYRYDEYDDNSVFNISASIFSIVVFSDRV